MSEIILYPSPDGAITVEVAYENDTFWLTQQQIVGAVTQPERQRYRVRDLEKHAGLKSDQQQAARPRGSKPRAQ